MYLICNNIEINHLYVSRPIKSTTRYTIMKTSYKLIAMFAATALTAGNAFAEGEDCTDCPHKEKTETTTELSNTDGVAQKNTVTLEVNGMKCGASCTDKVQSVLKAVEGVSEVAVTMPNKAVVKTDGKVTSEQLIKAIEAAGFKAAEKKS